MAMTPNELDALRRISAVLADAKRAAKTGDKRLINSVAARAAALDAGWKLAELKRTVMFGPNWPH